MLANTDSPVTVLPTSDLDTDALDVRLRAWLERFLARQGAVAGTVHTLDTTTDTLALRAAVRIPDKVLAVISRIPRGKGMAGLALAREQPVSTCDLKDNTCADVLPGARAVEARGAVALPIRGPAGVRAVVGLAYAHERAFSKADLQRLAEAASALPQ